MATAAIRDEGTSYPYLPPTESVEAPADLIPALLHELSQLGLPVQYGTVWTTDAPYRETVRELKMYAGQNPALFADLMMVTRTRLNLQSASLRRNSLKATGEG